MESKKAELKETEQGYGYQGLGVGEMERYWSKPISFQLYD